MLLTQYISVSPTNQAQDRVSELLATVNLTDAQDKKIGALSGGICDLHFILQM